MDDMENISLDDIKRSPECTYVSILSKMIVMHISLIHDHVRIYVHMCYRSWCSYILSS